VEANQAWAKNVGALLISVVAKKFTRNGNPNRAAEHDIGLAAANMVLQATALGLQGHQMIGIEPTKVRAIYGVPESYEPLTAIALGYPVAVSPGTTDQVAQRDLVRRPRKLLSEIIIGGAWGHAAKLD
jgi:nitroreductase